MRSWIENVQQLRNKPILREDLRYKFVVWFQKQFLQMLSYRLWRLPDTQDYSLVSKKKTDDEGKRLVYSILLYKRFLINSWQSKKDQVLRKRSWKQESYSGCKEEEQSDWDIARRLFPLSFARALSYCWTDLNRNPRCLVISFLFWYRS